MFHNPFHLIYPHSAINNAQVLLHQHSLSSHYYNYLPLNFTQSVGDKTNSECSFSFNETPEL